MLTWSRDIFDGSEIRLTHLEKTLCGQPGGLNPSVICLLWMLIVSIAERFDVSVSIFKLFRSSNCSTGLCSGISAANWTSSMSKRTKLHNSLQDNRFMELFDYYTMLLILYGCRYY